MAMFDVVAKGFRDVRNRFEGKRELTEDNIDDALKDIRMAMLEADVNFKITKQLIERVKEKAVGEIVKVKAEGDEETVEASPGDHFVKICHDELENLLGPANTEIHFTPERMGPSKIMLVGLQGSGKTTTSAKLASYLIDRLDKKPLLAGADVYRPAAINQLRQLGEQADVPVHAEEDADPVDVCKDAVEKAKNEDRDTVIM
ncbi:MAG: signal recognition particle receptor subunit alpha, partial [Bradymonadaceae bacterium]